MPALKHCPFRSVGFILILGALSASGALAQSEVDQLRPILSGEILPADAALFQLKQYLIQHTAAPPVATTAEKWGAESKRIRERLLREVVFHGWPKEWVDAPPRFQETGVIETGQGYRLRKLRYEIIPGFYSAAILYEPERIAGKAPAIVNVNGHVGAPGKAVEYKQKRCINFAKRGILALNLEWLNFGELNNRENQHWFGAHMDLVGTHELGLFYLAMRKGIDYLYDRPDVDRGKIGVTGLSGGGWQTIVLSALDERVAVSVPVAGFSSNRSRIEAREHGDLGDIEQSAADLIREIDYPHLVAMRAPRPTLLVYNAEDDCCFRGPIAKPYIFDAIRPIFQLYGKADALDWHENLDPGTHNYQIDNRIAAYRFFSKHFGLPAVESEIPSDGEIRSYDELVVGLPQDNLTILGLARKIARGISRPEIPTDPLAKAAWAAAERTKFRDVIRYKQAEIARSWIVANTKNKEVESLSFLFEMADGPGASAVFLKAIRTPAAAPATIILHDKGMSETAVEASDRLNRGEQVLAADLMFVGAAWKKNEPAEYAQIVHGMGNRVLGMQASQLIGLTRWLRGRSGTPNVRIEVTGMRSQAVALAAAAIEPALYSEVVVRDGIQSWYHLLEKPVEFSAAPELFCLDLYKHFDLDRVALLAAPVQVKNEPGGRISPR